MLRKGFLSALYEKRLAYVKGAMIESRVFQ
jgi:hypothetical protein